VSIKVILDIRFGILDFKLLCVGADFHFTAEALPFAHIC